MYAKEGEMLKLLKDWEVKVGLQETSVTREGMVCLSACLSDPESLFFLFVCLCIGRRVYKRVKEQKKCQCKQRQCVRGEFCSQVTVKNEIFTMGVVLQLIGCVCRNSLIESYSM